MKQNNLITNINGIMSDNIAETSVETVETVDWEQRAKRAEAKIVDMKKSTTEYSETGEEADLAEPKGLNTSELEAFYNEKKFFESNPEMSEYKDALAEYTSKWISWDKAKALVELDDPTIANRKVAKQANFTSWETPLPDSTTYSQDDLIKMPQAQYEKVMALKQEGKVVIT